MRILITGGAGFVGSCLAKKYREKYPQATIVVLDNLHRRGGELNLEVFKQLNIEFVHGDIRIAQDLDDLSGNFDLFVEASAEPSVHAGVNGSPNFLLQSNLVGLMHCLEFFRRRAKQFIFLSTSRVYSIEPLCNLKLEEEDTRFRILEQQSVPGVGERGISENFPTNTARSLYGASKLAAEQIIQEYCFTYDLNAIINRCGVIAGPGQFGKVDQGVFTLWVANHYFQKNLQYIGFGGNGKQVRDLLHPEDLFDLMEKQCEKISSCSGEVFNVGGGLEVSTSLLELTQICEQVTGNTVKIASKPETSKVDIPVYISDTATVQSRFRWQAQKNVQKIVQEIADWLKHNESELKKLFA